MIVCYTASHSPALKISTVSKLNSKIQTYKKTFSIIMKNVMEGEAMSAKKLKKIAVTIGFKADNTPIKKAFYGRSTAQAKSRAERWLESHGTPEKQADILTLGGWAARWLNVYKKPDVTPTAYTTTYEITVRRHILPALGSCVMMDLTPMDIKAFYNSVSHLSKSVCSKIKMCINGILETAVENGLCEHNPAHKVKIESTATPRVKEVFSNAEIEIASAWFLQTMPEVVLALETGVRRGELLGFFKSDFDTRRHVYSVARTVRKPRGQAPETAAPKSLSYRTNPLTDRALQAVELLRQRYPDSPYLIPGPDGGLMRPDTWSRRLKTEMDRMAQRHKDMPRLTAHELRHTHGTYLRRHGVDIYSIAKILGHKDVEVTARIYVHNELNELRKALRWMQRRSPIISGGAA